MTTFQHKVDKSQIPVCNILGVNIATVDMDGCSTLQINTSKNCPVTICVSNVHTAVTVYGDKPCCDVQKGGIWAISDGGPLSTVGRKRGYKNIKRTIGPSYMGEILKISAQKGDRHFLRQHRGDAREALPSTSA